VDKKTKVGLVLNVHSFLIRSPTSGLCPDSTNRVTFANQEPDNQVETAVEPAKAPDATKQKEKDKERSAKPEGGLGSYHDNILILTDLLYKRGSNNVLKLNLGPDFSDFIIIVNKLAWYDPNAQYDRHWRICGPRCPYSTRKRFLKNERRMI